MKRIMILVLILTINYQYFYDRVMKEEVPVADLYTAIGKLEIISITLDREIMLSLFLKA